MNIERGNLVKRNRPQRSRPDVYARLDDHEGRIIALETLSEDIQNLNATISKMSKHVRAWLPTIASALVVSGLASGKWGAFLHALFN